MSISIEPELKPDAGRALSRRDICAAGLQMYFADSGLILLVIAVTIFAMFLPVLIASYAFSDDYPLLSAANGFAPTGWFHAIVIEIYGSQGRPFAGLAVGLLFRAAGSIGNLSFVRLGAVIGIMGIAILLHFALVRAGIRSRAAALIAVLVCSMPPFGVYAAWATTSPCPYAAVLAGCASLVAVAAADAHGKLATSRLLAAIGMMVASLLVYQPAAMFFWVFFAIALIGVAPEHARGLRIVRSHVVTAAIALPIAFAVVKLSATIMTQPRSTLTHDPIGKIRWFLADPLYRALNLYELTPSRWLACMVAAIAAGGLLILFRRRCTSPAMYIAIAAALVPLTYFPNLVVAESWASYRSQVSLSALIVVYLCFGALGIWAVVRNWLQLCLTQHTMRALEHFLFALSIGFVGACVLVAARNVATFFVEPQSTELQMIRSQVAALPAGISRIGFVRTSFNEGMAKSVGLDEYGIPSTAQLWSLRASVVLILQEEGRLTPRGAQPIVDILPWETTTLPTDEPVIDVRGIRRFR
jgi:hypothetical protein